MWRLTRSALFHLEEGRIGSLGVSVQNPDELIRAISHKEIEHIQMPFNILDWRWRDAIVMIREVKASRPLVIHLRSVYLQGLLLIRDADRWQKANCTKPDAIFEWLESSRVRFGRESIQDLCIAFVNSLDWADGVVLGMETHDQLVENMRLFAKDPHRLAIRGVGFFSPSYLRTNSQSLLWATN